MNQTITSNPTMGALQKAPEAFVAPSLALDISKHGINDERRGFLRKSFLAAAGTALAGVASAQASKGDPAILVLPEHSKSLGQPVATEGYGSPSKFEKNLQRRESPGLTAVGAAGVSFAPLQALFGIITPNGLHFERHHQGWFDIDPSQHRLMVHGDEMVRGLAKKSLVFTMDELMRLPSVSRMHFIECGANTGMEWGNVAVPTVQYTHGMLSCCEYTGVPLKLLLDMIGVDYKRGKYLLAEGADGSSMTRTINLVSALNDTIVAWGMNGEMLRPENGYPLRLVVPGVQGVSWVKYLRRLKVSDKPFDTKDEVIHYVDMMPDGISRQFSSIQECKSVITSPSGGQKLLTAGYYTITGLAWSGRGAIKAVDVSVDGGISWKRSRLESPVLDKCLTRFNLSWDWNPKDGKPAMLQSRAIDSTGYVQPKYGQLRAVRGTRSIYHNNAIQTWRINASGEVENVHVA
jgi:sulfane dehydrogenase subunit SoxC